MANISNLEKSSSTPQNFVSLDDLITPVWIYDTTRFHIHWANKRALALWESDSLKELISRNFRPETSEAINQTLLSYLDDFERAKSISRWWRFSPNGVVKDVFCQFSGVTLNDGRRAMLCEGLEMDVSQSNAFMSSAIIVSTYDAKMQLISANPTFKEFFGHHINKLSDILFNTNEIDSLVSQMDSQIEFSQDFLVNTLDGERWHNIHIRRFNQKNKSACFLITQNDIHQRKERELMHAQQAITDTLTGLYNRYAFENQVNRMIDRKTHFTLFYIDLDGFKPINDSYGHKVGDIILQNVARRLEKDILAKAIACRIGGDEFVITVADHERTTPVEAIADNIIQTLSKPFEINKQLFLSISASIGIAHFPTHGSSHENLLATSDTAMYVAKKRGRRRYVHYEPGMKESTQRQMLLAQALPLATQNNELSVHYQPIVNLSNSKIEIIEGLIRWNNPGLGNIPAEETIKCAEEIGLISEIETWVINQACKDLNTVRQALGAGIRLSVNISGLHLLEPDFIATLDSIVNRHHLVPNDLITELTEGTLIPAAKSKDGLAHQLNAKGYNIAIDDFGTGYSSLAYLHRFPTSYVKIDKAFIERIEEDESTVSCINHLITTLGMHAIAEGVENKEQIEALVNQNVILQQGFFLSHPLPLEKLVSALPAVQQNQAGMS